MRLLPILFFCACSLAQTGSEGMRILEGAARKYQALDTFELTGTATRAVAGDMTARVRVEVFYASPRMVPEEAPFPDLDGRSVRRAEIRDAAGNPAALPEGRQVMSPDCCFTFRRMAEDVLDAALLRSESIDAAGESRLCDVVSVRYKDQGLGAREQVAYWIGGADGTVWKFEAAGWTVVAEKWAENQPLTMGGSALKRVTEEDQRLAGRAAPEIEGRTGDGRSFTLSGLRGKIVVLDFWATNCGYCSEEMAGLEQLRAELKEVEVLGVNEESPELARKWLAEHKRSLPVVMVEPGTAFKQYNVESLPSTVIVDREGKVVKQWVQFTRGSRVKRVIESLGKR